MKNSTKLLALSAAVACGLSAQAEATFSVSSAQFPGHHRGGIFAGDVLNNDRMDIFYGGQWDPELEKPGIWAWNTLATFAFNNGNDDWTFDRITAEMNEEPNMDDEGNVILDENGEPSYNWHTVAPKHGVGCNTYGQVHFLDYDNDGNLDMLVFGENNGDDWISPDELKRNHLRLYRNNGDGTFTLEEKAQFPICKPQKSRLSHGIAVGDYDRDGYVDFFVTGVYTNRSDYEMDETEPEDISVLYRNVNGTGEFERMDIAHTQFPVTTSAVEEKDDEGNVINVVVPARTLENWFVPIRGEVYFADFNNDGWLDIVQFGETHYENGWPYQDQFGGNACRVYINHEGEYFEDVTPEWGTTMYTLRNGSGSVNDLDGDGMLDFFHIGWGDNGYAWEAFLYSNTGEESVFDLPQMKDDLGIDGDEEKKVFIRDFDGDGNPDIVYTKKDNTIVIFYGSMSGTYEKVQLSSDDFGAYEYGEVADFNNDGLSDILYAGDWGNFNPRLYYNTTDAEVAAPAAPENVSAEWADGKLTISWDEVDGAAENRWAYNVYVKGANGLYTLVPANIETGFVKIAHGKQVALRPDVTSYSISVPEGSYTVGVQTIGLLHETYSTFNTFSVVPDGIAATEVAKSTFAVKTDAEGVFVEGNGEAVTVVNALGQTVATGVAGSHIAVPANGVLMVVKGNETAKVVK